MDLSNKMKRNEKNAKNGKNICVVYAEVEKLTIFFRKIKNIMLVYLMK